MNDADKFIDIYLWIILLVMLENIFINRKFVLKNFGGKCHDFKCFKKGRCQTVDVSPQIHELTPNPLSPCEDAGRRGQSVSRMWALIRHRICCCLELKLPGLHNPEK